MARSVVRAFACGAAALVCLALAGIAVAAGEALGRPNDIILAGGSGQAVRVVQPANPTALERRGAEVLRVGLAALSGVQPALVEGGGDVPAGAICILRAPGAVAQGFAVKAVSGYVELSGNPLAAAFALLDHLGWSRVSLYQEQDWGVSVRPPRDRVLKVPADLDLSDRGSVPVRAFVLTRPGELLDEFLDWSVGHGLNRVIIRATQDPKEREVLVRAAAARGLVVEYGGPGAFADGDAKTVAQQIALLLEERPEISVVDVWPTDGRQLDVGAHFERLRTIAAQMPPGKQLATCVTQGWRMPAEVKPLPANVFLWLSDSSALTLEKGALAAAGVAASPAHAGLLGEWLGSDGTPRKGGWEPRPASLFSTAGADVAPIVESIRVALNAKLGGVACVAGPGRWFWDAYSDAAFIFAAAASGGVTDLGVLRRRYAEVAYPATVDLALGYFEALDQIRARQGVRDWPRAVAEDAEAYALLQKARDLSERARLRSPSESAQRKRWVWLKEGLGYHAAQVEAVRQLNAADAIRDLAQRATVLRTALAGLLSYNQAKVAALDAGQQYGLTEHGHPVGLENELMWVQLLRQRLFEATGAAARENLARGAAARVGLGLAADVPVGTVTDGNLLTAAAFEPDPLVRVTVDLGAERQVKRVRFLNASANMVTAFRIQVAPADGALATVAQGRVEREAMFDWQEVTFAPQRARHVVLRVDGFASLSPGGGAGLAEIEVE